MAELPSKNGNGNDGSNGNGQSNGRFPSNQEIVVGYRTVLMALVGLLAWLGAQIWNEVRATHNALARYADTIGVMQAHQMIDETTLATHETRIRGLETSVTTIEARDGKVR